jgi:hypothetical protein
VISTTTRTANTALNLKMLYCVNACCVLMSVAAQDLMSLQPPLPCCATPCAASHKHSPHLNMLCPAEHHNSISCHPTGAPPHQTLTKRPLPSASLLRSTAPQRDCNHRGKPVCAPQLPSAASHQHLYGTQRVCRLMSASQRTELTHGTAAGTPGVNSRSLLRPSPHL